MICIGCAENKPKEAFFGKSRKCLDCMRSSRTPIKKPHEYDYSSKFLSEVVHGNFREAFVPGTRRMTDEIYAKVLKACLNAGWSIPTACSWQVIQPAVFIAEAKKRGDYDTMLQNYKYKNLY